MTADALLQARRAIDQGDTDQLTALIKNNSELIASNRDADINAEHWVTEFEDY